MALTIKANNDILYEKNQEIRVNNILLYIVKL